MPVRRQLRAVSDIAPVDEERMFALFSRYYKDVTFERFRADLAGKNHVVLLSDGDRLVGFTTILRQRRGQATCLFSGDTVIDERYWGTKHLQVAFLSYIVRLKLRRPHRPLYWMLMSKGYRTYLLLRNFKVAYPTEKRPTPAALQRMMDEFYGDRFGGAYRAEDGLIVFSERQGAVRDGIADPHSEAAGDERVRFFCSRNPRFAEGEELACIAKVRLIDLARLAMHYTIGMVGLGGRAKTSATRT